MEASSFYNRFLRLPKKSVSLMLTQRGIYYNLKEFLEVDTTSVRELPSKIKNEVLHNI